MSNPAATIYIVTSNLSPSNPVKHIIDGMSSYDSDGYRADIEAGKIDELVTMEWDNAWTQGCNSFESEADAQAYSTGRDAPTRPQIIEITKDDVRTALLENFGA